MGTDSKRLAGVGGGYHGTASQGKVFPWRIFLIGDEGLGYDLQDKVNLVAKNQRIETTDQQRRRTQGYRGL